jgi:hypothetical protein
MMNIEGSGSPSGSISRRHGSADPDPDPHQNVMDPQHLSGSGRGGWRTPEPLAASIQTQSWHISFWQGPGSIRQHTLSLVHPQNVRFQNVRSKIKNVRFYNVRNVRFTKRQVFKTSGCKNVGFQNGH